MTEFKQAGIVIIGVANVPAAGSHLWPVARFDVGAMMMYKAMGSAWLPWHLHVVRLGCKRQVLNENPYL